MNEETAPSRLRIVDDDTNELVETGDPELVIAGFTARDANGVDEHLAELARQGIVPPPQVPAFYRVAASMLLQPPATLESRGAETSGEAEPVLIRTPAGELWIGIGSDHTDRALERESIAASKRACGKVVGTRVWRYETVAARWDRLVVESWHGAEGHPYQSASAAYLRTPEQVLALADATRRDVRRPLVLFLGTVPLLDGAFAFSDRFVAALRDPDDGRELRCSYDVRPAADRPQPVATT